MSNTETAIVHTIAAVPFVAGTTAIEVTVPNTYVATIKEVDYNVNVLELSKSYTKIFEYGLQRILNDAANSGGKDATDSDRAARFNSKLDVLKSGVAKVTRVAGGKPGESPLERMTRKFATAHVMTKEVREAELTVEDMAEHIEAAMLDSAIIEKATKALEVNKAPLPPKLTIDIAALKAAKAAKVAAATAPAPAAPVPAPAPVKAAAKAATKGARKAA